MRRSLQLIGKKAEFIVNGTAASRQSRWLMCSSSKSSDRRNRSQSPEITEASDVLQEAPKHVDLEELTKRPARKLKDSAAGLKLSSFGLQDLSYAAEDDNIGQLQFKGSESQFPCLTKNRQSGPEPEYENVVTGYELFTHKEPFHFIHSEGVLPEINIAYETWGELNADRSNAVLIGAGLSASSHARSHSKNSRPGWWEKFVGPGCAVDTDRFFVICTNNLGGCYGSSGPSSINPLTEKRYGTTFPILTVHDMVRAQFLLLDHLGINKLYAAVGSSLGGMVSLTSAVMYPERVGRVVSISTSARSAPSSIALRYLQRKAIMLDPHWHRGQYYETNEYPRLGTKLAREIATMSYRSGPEWEERFGRQRIDDEEEPTLCPTFMIENYLDYQGESFCTKMDPNSLLYISKAMDLFDLGESYGSLELALKRVVCPTMVIGVKTDILFPVQQQRELAKALQDSGNDAVTYYELHSPYGHDTFLLELNTIGTGVKGFLETNMAEKGRAHKRKSFKKENKI